MLIGALLLGDVVDLQSAGFNIFLGVIPSTTSVGGGDSHLDARDEGTRKETSNSLRAEEETTKKRGDNDLKLGVSYCKGHFVTKQPGAIISLRAD